MATSYPGGLDAFSPAISGDNQSDTVGGRTHEAMHNDINDGVVAIQTELGADPAGASTTVVARLNAADAATIQKAGRYETFSSANTATAINGVTTVTGTTTITLPTAASISGQTFTIRNTGTAVVTIARTSSQTIDGTAANVTLLKGSITVASDGANWVVLTGSYVDETIGRRVYTWDNNSGRWQMTYGDTGWREVGADLTADWVLSATAGMFLIRRVGSTVSLAARIKRVTGSGARSSAHTIYTPPLGFRAGYFTARGVTHSQTLGQIGIVTKATSASDVDLRFPLGGTYAADEEVNFLVSWTVASTASAWPASLPGTASGTIPT